MVLITTDWTYLQDMHRDSHWGDSTVEGDHFRGRGYYVYHQRLFIS